MKNRFAKREELRLRIKRDVRCKDLLAPSKNGLYCCPMCHSGHKEHRTGAVQIAYVTSPFIMMIPKRFPPR